MNWTHVPAALAVAVVVSSLVLAGQTVMPGDTVGDPDRLGDGTATVESAALDDEPRITPGRFGTGVEYLRIPAVTVSLDSVTGKPRIVYTFAVPDLEFERVGTRLLAEERTVAVRMSDRAFAPDQIDRDAYVARVTVRVQSYTTDRIVLDRNVTTEVVR